MSNDDQQGTEVSGVVTRFYPSQEEGKPHGVYVDGDRYTTFNDEDVEEIAEGAVVQFRYEQNGEHRNVVPGSVTVVDTDEKPEVYGGTSSEDDMLPLTDARIMSQSILRSAVFHHQHREESTPQDVEETAKQFADAQTHLFRRLRGIEQEGDR
jgi:hypothetical protein